MAGRKSTNSLSFQDGITQSERRRLVELAQLIRDQETLNTILLDVAHPMQRGAVYDLIKPHLRFDGDYPAWVASYRAKSSPDILIQSIKRQNADERAEKQSKKRYGIH